MTGVALARTGEGPALRFERADFRGYEIVLDGTDVVVRGSDLVRAAYGVLEDWGCRFDRDPPDVPSAATLTVRPTRRPRERDLWVERPAFEPALPASGFVVRGLDVLARSNWESAKAVGLGVAAVSTDFDDFLDPSIFASHPEFFALRDGKRVPRGNFALTNPEARRAYLDGVASWLDAHPDIDWLGLWPKVTTVWCEESLALGAPEAYALLWREASARFPSRGFEILATGLTLRPPEGPVPDNVRVRFRPGEDASGLQGLAGQPAGKVVRAWEARGARVLLEIDAAPESWCGLPWPCLEAIRENAACFESAALRGGGFAEARIFLDPTFVPRRSARETALDERARRIRSWGDPRDAADLFPDGGPGLPSRVGALERLVRLAEQESSPIEERLTAAADAWFGYRALLREFVPAAAAAYRRQRSRAFERLLSDLLPGGAEQRIGPALVRESPDSIVVETDLLRLRVDPHTASVVGVARRVAGEWRTPLEEKEGRFFSVVSLGGKVDRADGSVDYEAPDPTSIRLSLSGSLRANGPRFRSDLTLEGGSARIVQVAHIDADERIVTGCRFAGAALDRWVCPAYAAEGAIDGTTDLRTAFPMPPGTLLYCREGEWGIGVAARLPAGGVLSLTGTSEPTLAAIGRGPKIEVEWILFSDAGELGR